MAMEIQTRRVGLRVNKRALHFSFYGVQIKGKDTFSKTPLSSASLAEMDIQKGDSSVDVAHLMLVIF